MISPGEFVPLAVESGLMIAIGRVVLRDACRNAASWRRRPGCEHVSVMVNLTAAELENPLLVAEVASALAEHALPPEALSLEITESGAMLDPEATIERLHRLRRLGVRIALDDFGTGYSSLSHLARFPIDLVKIPKDFVDRVCDDAAGRTFVDTILRLADALGLETVAEGIEQPSQASSLHDLKCRFGQGFHFARPLDTDAADRYLLAEPAFAAI
jgi:EAL domain-containing protein (putative c-di-GMP-specific phosphodiesterase class I)